MIISAVPTFFYPIKNAYQFCPFVAQPRVEVGKSVDLSDGKKTTCVFQSNSTFNGLKFSNSFDKFLSKVQINGPSKSEFINAKNLYEGTWVNKKTKRFIAFYFDDDVKYVTINDWTGNSNRDKNNSIDAYKVFIKGNKLIIPAENSDHHAPYCEIEILDGKLIYKCNAGNNFTDSVILKTKLADITIFERVDKK